jgi:signal peptidase II
VIPRRALLAAIIAITLLADQASKEAARRTLRREPPVRLGVLTLVYAENNGAFLSMGACLPHAARTILFNVLVGAGLAVAAFFLFRKGGGWSGDDVAVAFIVAGGLGNLIDRIRTGWVADFFYLAAGPLHTGVFNVADMAITGGVVWLLLSWVVRR